MRRVLVILCALAAAALAAAPAGQASCIASARYHGILYLGAPTRLAITPHDDLAGVMRPACNDTGGNDPDTPLAAQTITGVPARVAFVEKGHRRDVYLAPGFFPELRSHPLHRAMGLPDAVKSCAHPVTLRGRTAFQPGYSVGFSLKGSRTFLQMSGRTRYHGPRKLHLPYVRKGDHVRATGCRSSLQGYPLLRVSRISVSR